VFTAVLRTIPTYAAWLDVLDPITPIFQMAGLHNTMRRLVVDGDPVVTGLHAIGDSVCTTNPSFGRGLSLALSGAADLLDVVERHADDCTAQARVLDGLVADHVVPFYEDQAMVDYARLLMLRHTILNDPAPEPPPVHSGRVSFAQLRSAGLFDPIAFRGLSRVMGTVSVPHEVYTDPEVVASTQETLRQHGAVPWVDQPTREQLVAALGQ
jgi:hypothetical protein